MSFEYRQILDVGTSNPIVARLGSQTADLIQWIDLPQPALNSIQELYLTTLTQRLVKCEKNGSEIAGETQAQIERARSEGVSSRFAPHVIQLEELAEAFLYGAKNFLRDLTQVLAISFGCTLKAASDFADAKNKGRSKAHEWAAETIGAETRLSHLLELHTPWITETVKLRNAAEHPGGHSGTLIIENLRVVSREPLNVMPPTWSREAATRKSSMVADMKAIMGNLLFFAEELLAETVLAKSKLKNIAIYEVPEAERDPFNPVRLRINLDQEMMRKLAAAQRRE
jgi:hypothetical protein